MEVEERRFEQCVFYTFLSLNQPHKSRVLPESRHIKSCRYIIYICILLYSFVSVSVYCIVSTCGFAIYHLIHVHTVHHFVYEQKQHLDESSNTSNAILVPSDSRPAQINTYIQFTQPGNMDTDDRLNGCKYYVNISIELLLVHCCQQTADTGQNEEKFTQTQT